MYLNTFLYYFQNIILIHSIHYKFENERNIRRKISSIIQYVNNITDMHVIYYITCWLNFLFELVAYRISYGDFVLFNVFLYQCLTFKSNFKILNETQTEY